MNVKFQRKLNQTFPAGFGTNAEDGKLYFAKDGIWVGKGFGAIATNTVNVSTSKYVVEELIAAAISGIKGGVVYAGSFDAAHASSTPNPVIPVWSLNSEVYDTTASGYSYWNENDNNSFQALTQVEGSYAPSVKSGYMFVVSSTGTFTVPTTSQSGSPTVTFRVEAGDSIFFKAGRTYNQKILSTDFFILQNNTDIFIGATSTVAGTKGLVPAPSAGSQNKYLKGDGTWTLPVVDVQVNTSSVVDENGIAHVNPGPGLEYIYASSANYFQVKTGDGLTKNANNEVVINAGDGVAIDTNDKVSVSVDNSSIEINTSKKIAVKDEGITNTKIASNAALSNGQLATATANTKGAIKIGAGLMTDPEDNTKLQVHFGDGLNLNSSNGIYVDATEGLETDEDGMLIISDSGVTTSKIANSNVTTAKIADNAITSDKLASQTVITFINGGELADANGDISLSGSLIPHESGDDLGSSSIPFDNAYLNSITIDGATTNGIDSTVTSSSTNLITSGAVYTAVQNAAINWEGE